MIKPLSNKKTGTSGVSWDESKQKYYAGIVHKGKSYSLGYYTTFELAAEACINAEKKLLREFLDWYDNCFGRKHKG